MLTFKDYQKETIYEAYSSDMVKEINTSDIKTLSNVLNVDWSFNIQSSNFVKVNNYIGSDGKFIYNARKSYSGNPVVVVLDKTRRSIHVARFGYMTNTSSGSTCYTWPLGGYINRRDQYKMSYFNSDIDNAIKNNNDLSVFVCEKPVIDRFQIRNDRKELSAVPDNGTIQDRLAKQKFENLKNEYYIAGKNSTVKDCITMLNINSMNMLKRELDLIDSSKEAFSYKVRDCVKNFDKRDSEISSYRFRLEDMERMIRDKRYDTGWRSMEESLNALKNIVTNLKRMGIWK